MDRTELVTVEAIQYRVVLLRGLKVILDVDLAQLYQVKTKALNQAIKRNNEKFPENFMFQLTQAEMKTLGTGNRSQIVTGSQKHRDPKSLPYAFTEFGSTMDVKQWRPSTSLGITQDMFRHDGLGRV